MGGKDLHNRIKINKNSDEAFSFYASMAIEKVLECLSTSVEGLYGNGSAKTECVWQNVITTGKKIRLCIEQKSNNQSVQCNFVGDCCDYFYTDVVSAATGLFDGSDYFIIGVAFSVVAFVQDRRSDIAIQSLSKMISNKADVLCDGKLTEIDMDEIVVEMCGFRPRYDSCRYSLYCF